MAEHLHHWEYKSTQRTHTQQYFVFDGRAFAPLDVQSNTKNKYSHVAKCLATGCDQHVLVFYGDTMDGFYGAMLDVPPRFRSTYIDIRNLQTVLRFFVAT